MIDAVITWVDGDDPAHIAKRALYLKQEPQRGRVAAGTEATRFSDRGEVFFCIKLLRINAPWIGNIFLVTDEQRPGWLDQKAAEDLGVVLVDHKVIFHGYEQYLPTFNSRSIESVLHRIPGLSEDFLYLNDDIFVINPISKDDYFPVGRYAFRGQWQQQRTFLERLRRKLHKAAGRRVTESRPRGLVGRRAERKILEGFSKEYFAIGHAPYPLNRDLLRKIIEESGLMELNIRYRFRNKRQFNVASLFAHSAISEGVFAEGGGDWEYISGNDFTTEQVAKRLERCVADPNVKSLCVQSLDLAHPSLARLVFDFLEDRLSLSLAEPA